MKRFAWRFFIPLVVVLAVIVGIWSITHKPHNPLENFAYQTIQVTPDQIAAQLQAVKSNQSVVSTLQTSPSNLPKKNLKPIHTAKTDPNNSVDVVQTAQKILDYYDAMKNRTSKSKKPMASLPRDRGRSVPNPDQQKAIDELLKKLGKDADLQMDNVSRTLRLLKGDLKRLVENSPDYAKAQAEGDFGAMSSALLQELQPVLNIYEPKNEFTAGKVQNDELGMVHVKLQQQYKGVPIWGAEVGVHYNAKKEPVQILGVYAPTPANMPTAQQEITEQTALSNAKQALKMQGDGLFPPKIIRMIYWDIDRSPVMTYRVELSPRYDQNWQLFISVADGSVVHRINLVCTAAVVGSAKDLKGNLQTFNAWDAGNGKFYAIDTTKKMFNASSLPNNTAVDYDKLIGCLYYWDFKNQEPSDNAYFYYITSTNKDTWDPAVVSVARNFSQVYDYFLNTFNRNSVDDKGLNIRAVTHFRWSIQGGGSHNENACWSPSFQGMLFGDGTEDYQGILPDALDVVAHELTHGFTNFSSNLIYENQSGALNESISDYFGCMVDRSNWLLGETVINPKYKALRDMQDPANPQISSQQPKYMKDYVNWPIEKDQGGVHVNSGIPNYACYLLASGPTGISREKTEKIIYRVNNQYLTQRAQFIDFRRACITAAEDLFGQGGAEAETAKKVFDEVGITEGGTQTTPSTPSTPGTPTSGDEFVLFLLADPTAGWDFVHDDFYYMLLVNGRGQTGLAASRYCTNTRPAVSGDGEWALYVDASNNLYWTNGQQEEQWVSTGSIRTIAITKDQHYIVFTTTKYDNIIGVIDTVTKQTYSAQLSIQQADGQQADLAYADVLSFNFRGDYLIYDAVAYANLSTGEKIPVWGIYAMRMTDRYSNQMFPVSPEVEIGNPSMSNTQVNLLLADMVLTQDSKKIYNMIAMDFNAQKIGILLEDLAVMANPTYRGDDKKLLFRGFSNSAQEYHLVEGTIGANNISMDANNLTVVDKYTSTISYPVGFREGTYTPHAGKISAPASLPFSNVPVASEKKQNFAVSNQGNGDLEILGIEVQGTDLDAVNSYRHNGINQIIAPGQSMNFQVLFQPVRQGNLNAVLDIKSTDQSNPEIQVQLTGYGEPGAEVPTPTPVIQPTVPVQATYTPTIPVVPTQPIYPTNTPYIPPTPTPTPGTPSQDQVVYEFDQGSLAEDGWKEIPGGFRTDPPGTISPYNFFGDPIPSSKDKKGLIITVDKGQVAFAYAIQPINSGGKPVLLRLTARTDGPGASLALAALKGNLGTLAGVDNSIATHVPTTASGFVDQERTLVLLYEPDSGEIITPVFQVASNNQTVAVRVIIDRLEAWILDRQGNYAGDLFYATSQ